MPLRSAEGIDNGKDLSNWGETLSELSKQSNLSTRSQFDTLEGSKSTGSTTIKSPLITVHNQLENPTTERQTEHVKPLSHRFKKYVKLGIPSILCFLMMTIQEQINVVFIGSLSDPAKLAGIGLGNMVLNLMPYAILLGVNTALETFVSQASGRQDLRECGLYLHRAMFIICCIFIPIAISMFWASDALMIMGMDEQASRHAQTYLTLLLPGMLFNSLGDSIDLFLIGMGFNNVVLLLQITVIPIHFFCCWFFISVNEFGVEGAAFASNLTALLTLMG